MDDLRALIAGELAIAVDPRVAAFAAKIAAVYPGAARSVLFYGSCLWTTGGLDGQMLDFYLIVSDYRAAYGRNWRAPANRLIPPNVFPFEADGLAAKYAVLSEADFARLASAETRNISVWARFAQPSRIVWAADENARAAAIDAVAGSAPALLGAARPMVGDAIPIAEFWNAAFALTYGAELRAERTTRAQSVVEADPARYRRFIGPALIAAGIRATITGDEVRFAAPVSPADRARAAREWARRRREGKLLTLARLAKASATFAGGIDYLAWKINRHAGADVVIQPWQRRWPVLGAMTLLPRLIRGGAVK